MDIETIKVLLQAATLLAVVVGLGLTIYQLSLLRSQLVLFSESYEDAHDWNRRKAAQEAVDDMVPRLTTDTPLLHEKFQILTNRDRIPLETILEECEKDSSLRLALNRRLNYFESLAGGAHQGVFDEEVIKNSYHQVIRIALNQFREYIDHVRGNGYDQFCLDIEGMTERWNQQDKEKQQRDKLGHTSIRSRKSKGG